METFYIIGNHITGYFSNIPDQWNALYTNLPAFLPIIGSLLLIECLLSVDNAAVLATMVMDLPKEQRGRALKFGIIGAYVFRGICLILASFLTSIWWLEPIGGLYLLWIVYSYFKPKTSTEEGIDKDKSWLYKITNGLLGQFWATVAMVEIMDLTFSIDNVLAAAAMTPNIIVIWIGVFIGILGMRFIAQWFVILMGKFPFLETAAFVVIGFLGIKLGILSLYKSLRPEDPFSLFLGSHTAEWVTSVITILIFLTPIVTSLLFNYPRTNSNQANQQEAHGILETQSILNKD